MDGQTTAASKSKYWSIAEWLEGCRQPACSDATEGYFRRRRSDFYEHQGSIVPTSCQLDFNDHRSAAGFGELQPRPEFWAVSHVCLGFQQCQPDSEFDLGTGGCTGCRLGPAGQGVPEGAGEPEARPYRHSQRRFETADFLQCVGYARVWRRHGGPYA